MTLLERVLLLRADEQANAVTRDELQRHETRLNLTDDEKRQRLNEQKAASKRKYRAARREYVRRAVES